MMKRIDLSLVIACYNEEALLRESIARITSVLNDSVFSYELIFVDDKSSDGTREIIEVGGIAGLYPILRAHDYRWQGGCRDGSTGVSGRYYKSSSFHFESGVFLVGPFNFGNSVSGYGNRV
ncbi:MAG: Glycosyl transferase, group 2 family protein [Microgenomates group bacterium GW2011_GWA2_47_8]|nr:MAG: Glycosyl transferase, group 2 family protein [Microgenomates group bacterium GW2011_GWA2_47_8]